MSIGATAPLTFGQLSVWQGVEQLPADRLFYANMRRIVPVDPGVSVDDLVGAFRILRAQHEALRTTYDFLHGTPPRQIIHSADIRDLPIWCIPVDSDTSPGEVAKEISEQMRQTPFSLTAEEPWRVSILTVAERPIYFVIALHHIAADAWAIGLLMKDLQILLSHGLPGPANSPRELAVAQRSVRWKGWLQSAECHLRSVFTTVARGGGLPALPCPSAAVKVILRSSVALPRAAARARELRISLGSLMLAAYAYAAHEAIDMDTILVKTMTANRFYPGTANLVSSMNQHAAMASERRADESFGQFAQRIHWASLRAYQHGCYDP